LIGIKKTKRRRHEENSRNDPMTFMAKEVKDHGERTLT